jgi:hypothetical protein
MSHNNIREPTADISMFILAVKHQLLFPGGKPVRLATHLGECEIKSELRASGEISVTLCITGYFNHWIEGIQYQENRKELINSDPVQLELAKLKEALTKMLRQRPKTNQGS